ncbi:MAG TPA: hypothetical protein VI197_05055 [Polyangiaceae bacterium]
MSVGTGGFHDDTGYTRGTWWRVRGLVLASPPRPIHRHGAELGDFGVGPYLDFGAFPVGSQREYAVGAGLNGALWLGDSFAFIPAVGWYRQALGAGASEHGLNLGFALGGMHYDEWGIAALQWGIRVEARYGLGSRHERSWLVGGELDSLVLGIIPLAAYIYWAGD